MVKPCAANTIAENILALVDLDGYHSQMLECILYHKKEAMAVDQSDQWFVTKRGTRKMRETTDGWQFHIKWKDGTKTWVPLKLLKKFNPVETTEYASARKLVEEPAFAWWVPYTLHKRDMIIAGVNLRVRKATHKYGIEIPNSVTDAARIDKKNGNTFWMDAIKKEMINVGVAFKILKDKEQLPVGYKKATGHLVYDVKMDFTRKARWVKDGHRTPDPDSSSYVGMVSRESIRILLTHAALQALMSWRPISVMPTSRYRPRKALCYLQTRVRVGTCRETCLDHTSPLRG